MLQVVSYYRRGGLASALMVVAVTLQAPAVATSVVGRAPSWALALAVLGQAVVLNAQVLLLRRRVTSIPWSSHVEIATSVLSWGALLVWLGAETLSGTDGTGTTWAWLALAAALVSATLAGASVAMCRPRPDLRLLALLAGSTAGFLLQVLLHVDDATSPVPGAARVVLGALVAASFLVSLGEQPVVPRSAPRPRWAREFATGALSGAMALVVLTVSGHVDVPSSAVLLAALSVATGFVRAGLVVREFLALQASREEATTDELTTLPNRRALLRALGRRVTRGSGATLLLLDLDRFKEVNDTLGHHVGDELLRQVGARMRATVPTPALASRLGGDEFAILLPFADPGRAEAVARQVETVLGQGFDLGTHVVTVQASIGVALFDPSAHQDDDPGMTAVELLRRADVAMYAAKGNDLGPVLHEETLDERTRTRVRELAELRNALERGEIVLHYQPQVDVVSGSLRGLEALARWDRPGRGVLPPPAFLPLAEETGLMPAITRAVLEQAVRQAGTWNAAGLAVPVSVNLAAADVHPGLVPTVADLLTASGLPANLLVLEITETSVLHDPDAAAAVLTELRDLGVGVSLDDYGTGHSSLLLLLHLPVNEVKIDRSFVAQLLHDERHLAVISSSIDLAHRLGMVVVAEGVETEAMLDRLAQLGCDVSQGYLHSPPRPVADLFPALGTIAVPGS
ncbi:putative bifunctional diguanylate cyclase/phosphodiesterase [Kineococcus gynurae]|uniref:Bifunctional diguanylate cyclase/phosphodiesterase n=1 Tax=Kineococcus gynurae TaxID=452979 RepID=A0ABV5LQ48_9ACTN